MFFNAEAVTVIITFTSLGVEVNKPRELVDPRFIESINIGVDPFIKLIRCVLPDRGISQVTCPVVLFTSVSMVDVYVSVGFVTLLAVFQDELMQV